MRIFILLFSRSNVINMKKQGSILIRRTSKKESWLKYVQSISEKSLELDNYYEERKIHFQKNEEEEIVLPTLALPPSTDTPTVAPTPQENKKRKIEN